MFLLLLRFNWNVQLSLYPVDSILYSLHKLFSSETAGPWQVSRGLPLSSHLSINCVLKFLCEFLYLRAFSWAWEPNRMLNGPNQSLHHAKRIKRCFLSFQMSMIHISHRPMRGLEFFYYAPIISNSIQNWSQEARRLMDLRYFIGQHVLKDTRQTTKQVKVQTPS